MTTNNILFNLYLSISFAWLISVIVNVEDDQTIIISSNKMPIFEADAILHLVAVS